MTSQDDEELGCAWQQAERLSRQAQALFKSGAPERAYRMWIEAAHIAQAGEQSTNPQDSVDCSSVLWEIAEGLARSGFRADAERIVYEIRSIGKRARALETIRHLSSSHDA